MNKESFEKNELIKDGSVLLNITQDEMKPNGDIVYRADLRVIEGLYVSYKQIRYVIMNEKKTSETACYLKE